MLFDKINWNTFIVSFSFGMFFCYILTPKPRVVMKFPTPDNSNDVIYVDESENCYKYKADEVACPGDSNKISDKNVALN
tara:strand:- start:387 stop:623 length:237 start_codon:yes stop_codon:yes gene_type:complete